MTFFIHTFGCQMNVSDSEKMRHLLVRRGFVEAPTAEGAALVIVNTCAVRAKSRDKVFSYAGRLPKSARVIVTGCVAQAEGRDLLARHPRVAAVVGPHQLYRIDEIALEVLAGSPAVAATGFTRAWQEAVPDLADRDSRVTGYVSIMEGCDNFCSYCIVPFTRGREKNRPLPAILDEARELDRQGFAEIVLLGQNVNHWHDPDGPAGFPALLEQLAAATSIPWIRFITSYPGYHDPRLVEVMAANPRIARFIHFPAQSGSSRVLARMARRYSRAEYLRIIADFRRAIPDLPFSSDFIVGFPGESEHDFDLTLSLLEKVRFTSIFSFVYSPRPRTKAFPLPDAVPLARKKERLKRLQDLQESIQLADNRRLIGTVLPVLVTGPSPKVPAERIGRTESYRVVHFPSDAAAGSFVPVRITQAGPHSLRGVPA